MGTKQSGNTSCRYFQQCLKTHFLPHCYLLYQVAQKMLLNFFKMSLRSIIFLMFLLYTLSLGPHHLLLGTITTISLSVTSFFLIHVGWSYTQKVQLALWYLQTETQNSFANLAIDSFPPPTLMHSNWTRYFSFWALAHAILNSWITQLIPFFICQLIYIS